jgi:hypothetical protein
MADTGTQPLESAGRALENAFFPEEGDAWRDALRQREEACEALADASGLSDEAVIGELTALGIRAETLAALTLIPLVEVAWADDHLDAKERRAVLVGAESTGMAKQSPSHGLLRLWLERRPAPELMNAWRRFIGALCEELGAEGRKRLRESLLGHARAVALAAGGLRGETAISPQEEAMLAALAAAFREPGAGPSGGGD